MVKTAPYAAIRARYDCLHSKNERFCFNYSVLMTQRARVAVCPTDDIDNRRAALLRARGFTPFIPGARMGFELGRELELVDGHARRPDSHRHTPHTRGCVPV